MLLTYSISIHTWGFWTIFIQKYEILQEFSVETFLLVYQISKRGLKFEIFKDYVLEQTHMITLKNCVRYSKRLLNGDKMSTFTLLISVRNLFSFKWIFTRRNDYMWIRLSWNFHFQRFKLHFFLRLCIFIKNGQNMPHKYIVIYIQLKHLYVWINIFFYVSDFFICYQKLFFSFCL